MKKIFTSLELQQCIIFTIRISLLFFIFLILIFLDNSLHAATYYVDQHNGDDSNPGTSAEPWSTLNRAYPWFTGEGLKVQEGDTVLFRDGDYGAFNQSTPTSESSVPRRNNWITYKAESGHAPILSNIFISAEDKWSPIEHGRSYLIFDGFNVKNGISLQFLSYIQILNCNITREPLLYEGFYAPYWGEPHVSPGITARVSYHITVENCNIWHATRGISTNIYPGEHWVIKNNKIHHLAEDGIAAIGTDHIIIENNEIYDINKYRAPGGIWGIQSGTFSAGEIVVQAGTGAEGVVAALGYGTISVYQTSDASVATFLVETAGGGTISGPNGTLSNISKVDFAHTDGIQIDTLSGVNDVIIRGNSIHDIGYAGMKLAVYGNGKDFVIENNLVYNVSRIIQITGAHGLSMNNNTFLGQVRIVISNTTIVDSCYNNIIDNFLLSTDSGEDYIQFVGHGNNIFHVNPDGMGGPAYPFALDSTETVISDFNALFTDAANNNYTLASNSTAINFGNAEYAPETDITGGYRDAKPDAGCYEYGATPLKPENPEESQEPKQPPQQPQEQGFVPEDIQITVLVLQNNIIKTTGNNRVIIYAYTKEPGNLSLKIYDAKGKEIITLCNEYRNADRHKFYWSGIDAKGNNVGSGIYIVYMKSGQYSKTAKIAVVK